MAGVASNGILDGTLDKIAGGNTISVLTAEPASIADIASFLLAEIAVTAPDFTKANGDTNGRKVTTGAKSAVPITASGTATHIAVDDGVDFIATTCNSKALTNADTTNIPAWDTEIADPVAS